MLKIKQELLDAIMEHAKKEHPIECCGLIAGAIGSGEPTRFIPMTNAANSETYFQFDSKEQLQVWREMDQRDEEPVVMYHSHTASIAYPSREDKQFAMEPSTHYVIVSTDERYGESVRSFRFGPNKMAEERIEIIKDNS